MNIRSNLNLALETTIFMKNMANSRKKPEQIQINGLNIISINNDNINFKLCATFIPFSGELVGRSRKCQ